MRRLDLETRGQIQKVIDANIARLRACPGFLIAEPGFPIVNGWPVREPAIIVFVSQKKPLSHLLLEERIPRRLDGYRVDVLQADPLRQMTLNADTAGLAQDMEDAAASALTYEPLAGNPIELSFDVERPFLCHVGPDAGWPVLRKFIEKTGQTLSVAMYDLNADYIATTLIDTVRDNDLRLTLTWDDGMTGDEQTIRQRLKAKLGPKLEGWIVHCGGSRRFESAYHAKVAVRDSSTFWLSSGNWSKRSQPEIDPISDPDSARGMYSKGNREWHIVVDDTPLAKLFERYIELDRRGSEEEDTALGVAEPLRMPDLFILIEAITPDAEAALSVPMPVAPLRLPSKARKVTVQPVLCPDNYIGRITEFIKSAKRSLYLQFSYITYSDAPRDQLFQEMLDYVGQLSFRESFDLKIIVGNNGAADKVRKLVEAGYNEAAIRVQASIHNKGIIVDGEAVLVSSANWSSAGALRNRDAGLIIYDPEVASYYQGIFLDDWEVRARANLDGAATAVIAPEGAPTPQGMARISWRDFYGE